MRWIEKYVVEIRARGVEIFRDCVETTTGCVSLENPSRLRAAFFRGAFQKNIAERLQVVFLTVFASAQFVSSERGEIAASRCMRVLKQRRKIWIRILIAAFENSREAFARLALRGIGSHADVQVRELGKRFAVLGVQTFDKCRDR